MKDIIVNSVMRPTGMAAMGCNATVIATVTVRNARHAAADTVKKSLAETGSRRSPGKSPT
ncbi:MAG: hypothetical protein ACM3WU_08425 [Bacillota bacterium]